MAIDAGDLRLFRDLNIHWRRSTSPVNVENNTETTLMETLQESRPYIASMASTAGVIPSALFRDYSQHSLET